MREGGSELERRKEEEMEDKKAEEQERTNVATSSTRCGNHGTIMYGGTFLFRTLLL